MALVLRLLKGEDIFVSDERFVLEDVHPDFFTLRKEKDGALFTVLPTQATQILPNVMVSRGFDNSSNPDLASVVVEAPRSIKIFRGEMYHGRNNNGNK